MSSAGVAGRKVTDKRGGHIQPEGASPRFTGGKRGQYPKGSVPTPEGASTQGPSGSSQENTMKSNFVPPIITRATGDSQTTKNPAKG